MRWNIFINRNKKRLATLNFKKIYEKRVNFLKHDFNSIEKDASCICKYITQKKLLCASATNTYKPYPYTTKISCDLNSLPWLV
jgi:hypothetical protein